VPINLLVNWKGRRRLSGSYMLSLSA